MKKVYLIVLSSILLTTISYSQIRFGAGIDTNFSGFGIAAKANMAINEQWGGQIGYNFYLNNSNPTRLDVDATYLLTTAGNSDEVILKGLGGFNYWNSGVSDANSELGLNIGANISFPISDMNFYIEPRITLISRGDFFIGAGMYF